jgi:hypothetical protein
MQAVYLSSQDFWFKCFVLKHGNLDKFESHSSDGILFGYTPHGRSYRVFNLETNTIAGDNEMEESNFVDEELHGIDGDEDDPLYPSTLSSEHVPTFTLEAEAPHATTSFTSTMEASQVEVKIIFHQGAPSHIQKAHPPQQIIGNLNEKVTRS